MLKSNSIQRNFLMQC